MKKFLLILIFMFLLISSFTCGFLVKKHIDDKEYNNWEIERKNLEEKINFLDKLNDKYTNSDNLIDIKEKKCIDKADNAADVRNCVYVATEEWGLEINKYLLLLQKNTNTKQYKFIEDNQHSWVEQSKKDNKLINEFIFNHGGTIYYDIAASEYEEIIKRRAEFLKQIYIIHTDEITNKS